MTTFPFVEQVLDVIYTDTNQCFHVIWDCVGLLTYIWRNCGRGGGDYTEFAVGYHDKLYLSLYYYINVLNIAEISIYVNLCLLKKNTQKKINFK